MYKNKEKKEGLHASLSAFYAQDVAWAALEPFVRPDAAAPISLRLLDYFVVTYANVHDTSYLIRGVDGNELPFFVYSQYRTQLKRYNKSRFDPFCRGDKITFRGCVTSWRQLNFFRWAITHHVVDYAVAHIDEIAAASKAESARVPEVPSVRCYLYRPDRCVTVIWEPTPVPLKTFRSHPAEMVPATPKHSTPTPRPATRPARTEAMSATRPVQTHGNGRWRQT